MDKVKNLQEKARKLRTLLEKYAQVDDDAETVLGLMTPLFERIDTGEIVPPYTYEYRWYFGSTDSPLIAYHDLVVAAYEYSHALEDWPSPSSR